MRVLAIADSDSYIKWGASVLERMPPQWDRSIVVIATPAAPSGSQLAAALAGTGFASEAVPVLLLDDLANRMAVDKPDVVLLSVRGPVVRVLIRSIVQAVERRPVLVSGLPGISIPATRRALYYRAQVDYFLLHSKREIREFGELAERMGLQQQFGLGRLPFLSEPGRERTGSSDIVFAAQAKVPRLLEDRQRVVEWLVETAVRHPRARVVVKLRAAAGEQQTHSEKYPYGDLLAARDDLPDNLVVSTGSMADTLDSAAALVTVSSTAAIEAAALGVPVLVLDDFGVSGDLINVVFEGSGLLGDSNALRDARFARPAESWLDENYFHSPLDNDWIDGIRARAHAREIEMMPLRPPFRGSFGGALRLVWDRKRALGRHDTSVAGFVALIVGVPARWIVLLVRRPRLLARSRAVVEPERITAP